MILKESSLIVYFPIITVYQKHPLKACLCLISFASQSWWWWWRAKHFSFTSWGLVCQLPFCSFGLARPTWADGLSIAGRQQVDSRGRSFLWTYLWGFNGANAEQKKLLQFLKVSYDPVKERGMLGHWRFGQVYVFAFAVLTDFKSISPRVIFLKRTFDSSVLSAIVWGASEAENGFNTTYKLV